MARARTTSAGDGQLALLAVEPTAANVRSARCSEVAPKAPARKRKPVADPDLELQADLERAMAEQPCFDFNRDSDFAGKTFCRSFYRHALLHHVLYNYIISKKVFEKAFAKAMSHAGLPVWAPSSDVHPFDVQILASGDTISLKTETSQSIKREELTISKLAELSDSRMPRTPADCAQFAREEIPLLLDKHHRMIVMRAFQIVDENGRRCIEYVLLEIPRNIFDAAACAQETDVSISGQTLTLPLHVAGDELPVLELKFDTSVRKITVKKLRAEYCTIHASFVVPYGDEIAVPDELAA